jgi:hypothetical protein
LDAVAKRLLEQETIDTDEFEALMGVPKAKPELKLAMATPNGKSKEERETAVPNKNAEKLRN